MSMMDENGRIKPPPPKKKPIVQQPKRKVKPMSLEEKVENDTKTRAKLPPRQPRASRNEPNAATGKNNSLKRKRSPTSEHSRSAAVGGTARNDVKKVKARKKLQSASPEPMKSDGAGSRYVLYMGSLSTGSSLSEGLCFLKKSEFVSVLGIGSDRRAEHSDTAQVATKEVKRKEEIPKCVYRASQERRAQEAGTSMRSVSMRNFVSR